MPDDITYSAYQKICLYFSGKTGKVGNVTTEIGTNDLNDHLYNLSEALKPLKERREKLLEQVERIDDEIKSVLEYFRCR